MTKISTRDSTASCSSCTAFLVTLRHPRPSPRGLRFLVSFLLPMASYLRSWLPTLSLQPSSLSTEEEESPTTPTNISFSVQQPDDDTPPAFPAIESAQRVSLAPSTLMPPPAIPSRRIPGPSAPSASSLMPPPTTTKPPTQLSKSKKRAKVVLAPGHSPLDWAALKSSGADLRVRSSSLPFVNQPALLTMLSLCRVG